MEKKGSRYNIIYAVALALFIILILWLVVHNKYESMADSLTSDAISYDEGWHDAEGKEVALDKLQKLEGIEPEEVFCVYNVLPENLDGSNSLYFRSKNIYYSVYVDGDPVYTPEVQDSVFYTKSLGTRYNSIPLPDDYAGKEVEIRFSTVYSSSRASIDNIYIGDSGGLVLMTIKHKLVAFITCILMLFAGILLIVADIPANMQTQNNHELMYLGLFAITTAVWCLSETNLIQLYYNDSRTMQVVSCTALMLIPIPMTLYINAVFNFRLKYTVPLIFSLSIADIVVSWTLHLLNIMDIHEMLTFSHIALAVCAVALVYSIIVSNVINIDKKQKKVYNVLRIIGLGSLAVAAVADITRYYMGAVTDSAMFTRIGMLIFIICYGISSLGKIISAVKLGARSELISRLAYSDGLTGIGNRTAFEERLAELEKHKDELGGVGIVMFDLNDLKYVNDNFGHHYGDEMIEKGAEIITSAFEPEDGSSYRIGGDEFVVILSGNNVQERYENGIRTFRRDQSAVNDQKNNKLRISMAYGFGLYKRKSGFSSLDEVYQYADERMYENKKEIKAEQAGPEEYYKDVERLA